MYSTESRGLQLDSEWEARIRPLVEGLYIHILTPMAGGVVAEYKASYHLTLALGQHLGVKIDATDMSGNSVLPKARNRITYDALVQGAEWLYSIDSDMGWDPVQFFEMLALAVERKYRVLGANAAKKTRNWERAVAFAKEQGNKLTVNGLKMATIEFAVSLGNTLEISNDATCVLESLGMAFTCVHRSVYEDLARVLPSYIDGPDNADIPLWFDLLHCGPTRGGKYLGEDITFCLRLRQMHIEPRCWTPARMVHVGVDRYESCILEAFVSKGEE